MLEEERVIGLSSSKVNDLNEVHVSDNDIFWLDIQVQDAASMKVVQTLEDLRDISHHVIL